MRAVIIIALYLYQLIEDLEGGRMFMVGVGSVTVELVSSVFTMGSTMTACLIRIPFDFLWFLAYNLQYSLGTFVMSKM
jgi:hypothetical protein